MKGFKALNMDMSSMYGDMTYELNKKYTIIGALIPCWNSYHFCEHLEDIENYYTISDSRIFEVEAEGQMIVDDDKICAESITLIRELSKEEIRQYFEDNQEQILTKNWNCRKALTDQRLCLDKLIHDENEYVRTTVAKQGYGLDILVHDKNFLVRMAVAKQCYGLNILVHDKFPNVRTAVAEQGYGLDILMHDANKHVREAVVEQGYGLNVLVNGKEWSIRVAVAGQGYELDKLINDEDWRVRMAAKEKMEALR